MSKSISDSFESKISLSMRESLALIFFDKIKRAIPVEKKQYLKYSKIE